MFIRAEMYVLQNKISNDFRSLCKVSVRPEYPEINVSFFLLCCYSIVTRLAITGITGLLLTLNSRKYKSFNMQISTIGYLSQEENS